MAYQLAFDLENNATQKYLTKVVGSLTSSSDETAQTKVDKIKSILSGKETIKLQLEFLCRNNHTDMLILKNSKVLRSGPSARATVLVASLGTNDYGIPYYSRLCSMPVSRSTTLL